MQREGVGAGAGAGVGLEMLRTLVAESHFYGRPQCSERMELILSTLPITNSVDSHPKESTLAEIAEIIQCEGDRGGGL